MHNGIKLDSDSEMIIMKRLDELGIKYEYQPGPFEYLSSVDNKMHNYYPDLYLPEHNLFIEIKYNKIEAMKDVMVKDKLNGMKELGLRCILVDRRDMARLAEFIYR